VTPVRSALLEPGASFVGAPGAAALQVRDCDENHVLAVWRNVAIAIWMHETHLSAVGRLGELLAELTRGGKQAALLQVAERYAVIPNTEVREAISALLKARTGERAFHPNGAQQVLAGPPELLCFVRSAPDETSHVVCITSVSDTPQQVALHVGASGVAPGSTLSDLNSGTEHSVGDDGTLTLTVAAYGVAWLRSGG